MDAASKLLARGVPAGLPNSYRALADHGGVPHSTLHHRASGRRSLQDKARSQQYLTPAEDAALVEYLLQMARLGQPVRMKHIPALAFLATRARPGLKRPLRPPGRNWAKAFENSHPDLQSRRVKAMDWRRHDISIFEKITYWFEVIGEVLWDKAVLAENVYNMDETGVMLSVLGSVKVLTSKHDTRDYRGARIQRTTVTAIECISGDGRCLDPMIIWPASTHRSNWTMFPTPGWHYACSDSGYTDSKISLEWLIRVSDPQAKDRANGKCRLLVCDGFGIHETLEILEHCFANNIKLCRLPSHTPHKLQPCDVAVFAPLKAAYRDNLERLERGGVNTVGKEHFIALYSRAREEALTRRNILAGWSKAGLFPFSPDRVLRGMCDPRIPPTKIEGNVVSAADDTALPSPATPISAEGFAAMQDLIIKRNAHALDQTSKRNLQRHLQKLTKAAQISFTRGMLQKDKIEFLLKINEEAKTRRSTKSIVLGRAKVMSFEDFEEARATRREKEATQVAKEGRCRRRRVAPAQQGNTDDLSTQATEVLEQVVLPAEQADEEDRVEEEITLTLWTAPIARMW